MHIYLIVDIPVYSPFFDNETSTTETHTFPYTTLFRSQAEQARPQRHGRVGPQSRFVALALALQTDEGPEKRGQRSEEHTSELQSYSELVCRLLLEKKNKSVSPY